MAHLVALLVILAGPYDRFQNLASIDFSTGERHVSYRQGKEGRSFYIRVDGRPYKGFVASEIPPWLGVWRIVPLTGPAFEFELVFPHPYFEIKVRRTKTGLRVTFGELRREFIARTMGKAFLIQKLPLPEAKLMDPFPRIERLIAHKRYDDAQRLLEDLPIGYGNGLRGLRLGDIQLYRGKIATAARSYRGVVRRFGNLYFAALTRTRLIALEALVYRKFPSMKSLDGTLSSIRPKELQDLARRKVAVAYEGVNKLTDALHILEPVGDSVKPIRDRILASLIKYSLVSGKDGLVALYADRYSGILHLHPQRVLLELYVAESLLKLRRPGKVIALLQRDLASVGKWRKGDPLAERGFAYLAQAFCVSGNWVKCEGSTRYYLENRKPGAPHEGIMWEWYANALRHKGVFERAHVFYLTAIRSYWNESRAADLGLRLAREEINQKPRWTLAYIDAVLARRPGNDRAVQAVLLAYDALETLGEIDRAPSYFARVERPSAQVLVRHADILARLGDVGNEIFFLEAASIKDGPWARIALERLRYLRQRDLLQPGKDNALNNARR